MRQPIPHYNQQFPVHRVWVLLMHIAIVGSTSRTGLLLIQQALEAGHNVRAFARTPAKLTAVHPNLTAVPGALNDAAALDSAIIGQDVVISLIGVTQLRLNQRTTIFTESAHALLPALQRARVRRFIIVSSALAQRGRVEGLDAVTNYVFKPLLWRPMYSDMADLEDLVRATDLDWTIMRAARLNDQPLSRAPRIAEDARSLNLRGGTWLSRADLAYALLQEIVEPRFIRKTVLVAN